MKDKFHNKDGSLTAYAFACGYVEEKSRQGIRVTLERDSACWHVKAWDSILKVRLAWESLRSLTEARKAFKLQCRTCLPPAAKAPN